jgi:hypothetical protein
VYNFVDIANHVAGVATQEERDTFLVNDGVVASVPSTPIRPDHSRNDALTSAHGLLTPTVSGRKAKADVGSRVLSSTHKSKTTVKTLKDILAEGSTNDNQLVERLGTQKHERVIGEQELKRRKLENRILERKHQREREHEEHEFRMMQLRMAMSQGDRGTSMMLQSAPTQTRSSFEGLGLMAELNDSLLPSTSNYSV